MQITLRMLQTHERIMIADFARTREDMKYLISLLLRHESEEKRKESLGMLIRAGKISRRGESSFGSAEKCGSSRGGFTRKVHSGRGARFALASLSSHLLATILWSLLSFNWASPTPHLVIWSSASSLRAYLSPGDIATTFAGHLSLSHTLKW